MEEKIKHLKYRDLISVVQDLNIQVSKRESPTSLRNIIKLELVTAGALGGGGELVFKEVARNWFGESFGGNIYSFVNLLKFLYYTSTKAYFEILKEIFLFFFWRKEKQQHQFKVIFETTKIGILELSKKNNDKAVRKREQKENVFLK